jgi:uncharacterized Zn finger protein (UPF0148 family)
MALAANIFEFDVTECDWCGQPFYPGRDGHRFCKPVCQYLYWVAERKAVRRALKEYGGNDDEQSLS